MSNVSIINNSSDLTESNAPNNFDVKKAIVDLCAMDPEEAKGNSRTTGVPLPNLKAMAKHLGLGQSFAKPKLIENIIAKIKKFNVYFCDDFDYYDYIQNDLVRHF
jgi:hypothetical protein